jgi:hypothetical protein
MVQKYPDISLSDFDAAGEMMFPDGTAPDLTGKYYEEVILPDEERILLSQAVQHMAVVEPGAVVGDRIEFIVDGKAVVKFEEWQKRYDECNKGTA